MPRLLALTGVVLIALVGVGSAYADITPPEFNPSDDEVYWEIVNEYFDPLSPETQDALDRLPDMTPEEREEYLEKWKDGDADAKMRSRRWPRLRAFGGSILLSVGATVGLDYALKMEIPGQGFIYSMITGEAYGGTGSAMVDPRWVCLNTGATDGCGSARNAGSTTLGDGYWHLRSNGEAYSYWTDAAGAAGTVTTGPPGTGACASVSTAYDQMCALATTLTPTHWLNEDVGGSPYNHSVLRTDEEMEAAIALRESDEGEYDAATRKRDAGTYNPPTATTGDKEAAWSHGDTFVTNEYRDYIYIRMNPELNYSGSFSVPQPLPNETYTTYISRLQSLGWYGDATTTERSEEHDDYGPSAIVRLTVQDIGTGTARILDPIRWPSTNPVMQKSEDISLIYNPATATEVAEGTGSTPITAPPTAVPSTPAIDFTPVTDLDPGCKFPYGFICYAVDFTEQFNVAADAPVFSFTLGWTGTVNGQAEGGEAPYTVDLQVMDDYMALWRGILTVVLWVGAIYLVATRMLGFKAGGDPGEAIDDVL